MRGVTSNCLAGLFGSSARSSSSLSNVFIGEAKANSEWRWGCTHGVNGKEVGLGWEYTNSKRSKSILYQNLVKQRGKRNSMPNGCCVLYIGWAESHSNREPTSREL